MPGFIRVVLQLAIVLLLVEAVVAIASGTTGVAEKAVVAAFAVLLLHAGSRLRRRPAATGELH